MDFFELIFYEFIFYTLLRYHNIDNVKLYMHYFIYIYNVLQSIIQNLENKYIFLNYINRYVFSNFNMKMFGSKETHQ